MVWSNEQRQWANKQHFGFNSRDNNCAQIVGLDGWAEREEDSARRTLVKIHFHSRSLKNRQPSKKSKWCWVRASLCVWNGVGSVRTCGYECVWGCWCCYAASTVVAYFMCAPLLWVVVEYVAYMVHLWNVFFLLFICLVNISFVTFLDFQVLSTYFNFFFISRYRPKRMWLDMRALCRNDLPCHAAQRICGRVSRF